MKALVVSATVAGLLFLGVGAREYVRDPGPAPLWLAVGDLDKGPPARRWVTLGGGRGDLLAGAIRMSADGGVEEVYFPLRPVDAPPAIPARVVVASRDPGFTALFELRTRPADASDLQPELEFTGELVPVADAPKEAQLEVRKMGGAVSIGAWLLVDGRIPRPSLALPFLSLGGALLLGGLLLGAGRTSPARRPAAGPRRSPGSAGGGSLAASQPSTDRGATPPDRASFPVATADDPPFADAPPVASPADARPAPPGTVGLPPAGPAVSPAEEKRRLFEYASLAPLPPDELARKFRFVADKILVDEAGLRVFPVAGKTFDLPWEAVRELSAWRCPAISPWNELLVLELLGAREGRPEVPVRVTLRTQLDLSALPGEVATGTLPRLRRLGTETLARGAAVRVDPGTIAFLAGAAAPRHASLRTLAQHDARFPDPGAD